MAHAPMQYYVNDRALSSGAHEVHRQDCQYLPLIRSTSSLGKFDNCAEALLKAQAEYYPNSDGCAYCCINCRNRP
jgi:hypothetical protein